MSGALRHQPIDPITALCPCCRRPWPDEDGDLERLIRRNAGRVTPARIAVAAGVPLSRIQRTAARARPPIDLTVRTLP